MAACGQKAPDHSTIARFRTGFLADACENLFYQMVKRLENAGGLSKETVFIDGTKLEACANKYTFVWKKSVGKWETKMFQKIQEAVSLLNREYIQILKRMEEKLGFRYPSVTADSGYESEEGYSYLKEQKQNIYFL